MLAEDGAIFWTQKMLNMLEMNGWSEGVTASALVSFGCKTPVSAQSGFNKRVTYLVHQTQGQGIQMGFLRDQDQEWGVIRG